MTDRAQRSGWQGIHRTEVQSTNSEALAQLEQGRHRKFWLAADKQTAGRGRDCRQWQTGEGNLAVSYVFPTHADPANLPCLSLLAGVAVVDALRGLSGDGSDGLQLKWPNDILINSVKAGGILLETTTIAVTRFVIAGIGLNLVSAPEIEDQATAALSANLPVGTAPADVAAAIAGRIDDWLSVWDDGRGFQAVREAWLARSLPVGTRLTTKAGGAPVSGAFSGLDSDGALLLTTEEGVIRRISVGDVRLAD